MILTFCEAKDGLSFHTGEEGKGHRGPCGEGRRDPASGAPGAGDSGGSPARKAWMPPTRWVPVYPLSFSIFFGGVSVWSSMGLAVALPGREVGACVLSDS